MNAFPTISPSPPGARKVAAGALRVVTLYDGSDAASRAHDAVTAITMALRARRRVDSSLWSFDMLARLDIRHASVRSAADADVLMVVGMGGTPLPQHVASWLMACVRDNEKGRPLLVANFADNYRQAYWLPALRRDLLTVAKRWNMPLLSLRDLNARLSLDLLSTVTPPPVRVRGEQPRLDVLLSSPQRRGWGINE